MSLHSAINAANDTNNIAADEKEAASGLVIVVRGKMP